MRLFRERAGVISPGPCWVLFADSHMYTHESLFGLAVLVIREWRHDRHLIG